MSVVAAETEALRPTASHAAASLCIRPGNIEFLITLGIAPKKSRTTMPKQCRAQRELKNRRQSRSRRGDKADVVFAPESASLRRRLQFLNTSWSQSLRDVSALAAWSFCGA